MTDTTLAQLSSLAVYSAMAVLTLAMVMYAVYLARIAPKRTSSRAADRELVTVGGAELLTAPNGAGSAAIGADAERTGARKAGGVAWMLTLLGTLLAVAGVVLRGLEVHRWPLGNMYEFAIVGCMLTLLAYVAWASRRDLRWLGLFVVGPVLLTLGLATTAWYTDGSELMPSLRSIWLAIHVSVATLSVALFTIGFSLGIIYLVQARLEAAAPRPAAFMDRRPDSLALERLTYSIHVVA